MNLAMNFTPNYVTPLLESAVAAILPELENPNASMGTGPSFVLMKYSSRKLWVFSVLDPLDVSFVDVGVGLQCHAPKHTCHTTLCTLNGFTFCFGGL